MATAFLLGALFGGTFGALAMALLISGGDDI